MLSHSHSRLRCTEEGAKLILLLLAWEVVKRCHFTGFKARYCVTFFHNPGLCLLPAEIIEYTAPDETAVCNLASIALPRFVRETSQQVGVHLLHSLLQ